MKSLQKFILPAIIAVVVLVIWQIYFVPTKALGSFSRFSDGSEVNQKINVAVVKSKGFERDAKGGIAAFFARDKDNAEAKVTLHEPAPEEIVNADVVELMGHMHGNTFVAAKVSIIK